MVGEDGEEEREDELDGGLRGRDDVDELDGVFAGGLQPEGEGLDGARGLLGLASVNNFPGLELGGVGMGSARHSQH
jgi:hypothetical protein